MTSLRFRLTLTYLAVILVGMGLAALLAWLSVERLYLDAQKANLLAQAQLVASALRSGPNCFTGFDFCRRRGSLASNICLVAIISQIPSL